MTVEQIPIENFVANGFVIDISDKCSHDSNYLLNVNDFELTPQDFLSLRGRKNILLIR